MDVTAAISVTRLQGSAGGLACETSSGADDTLCKVKEIEHDSQHC